MYLDVIKKITIQKERIIKEFTRIGICPSQKIIEEKITQVDSYLALFKHHDKVSGDNFNVNEYNAAIEAIYEDLKILYEILVKHLEDEYKSQQGFISSHLSQLESLTEMYYKQALHESSSTTIGHSILFKNSGFTIDTEDSKTFIDFGELAIKECAEIACLANIHNCDHDNIIFEFRNIDTDEIFLAAAYNKYNETLKFPGEKKINTYEIKFDENQKVNGPVLMNIDTEIDVNNKYIILAGKEHIQFNDNILRVPSQLTEYRFLEKGHINFYVIGGKSAAFKFNKKPLSANFTIDDDKVKNLSHIHHFFIEAPEDFQFSVEIDKGDIYATKEKGIVNGDKLFYIGNNDVKNFYILEEKDGPKHIWNSRLKIIDNNEDVLELESIIIKEVAN